MGKIRNGILMILSFFLGGIFYFQFDLEDILWSRHEQAVISAEQITWNQETDYTGQQAGDGILSLTTGAEWEAVRCELDYVTAVPVGIERTNVYDRSRKKGASPYYIIELEDGTCLLAQMNQGIASRIQQGQRFELPLGRKMEISPKTKRLLAPACEARHVMTDYVLYTIDDTWKTEHMNRIFYGKIMASVLVAIIWAIVLQLIAERIPDRKMTEPQNKVSEPENE